MIRKLPFSEIGVFKPLPAVEFTTGICPHCLSSPLPSHNTLVLNDASSPFIDKFSSFSFIPKCRRPVTAVTILKSGNFAVLDALLPHYLSFLRTKLSMLYWKTCTQLWIFLVILSNLLMNLTTPIWMLLSPLYLRCVSLLTHRKILFVLLFGSTCSSVQMDCKIKTNSTLNWPWRSVIRTVHTIDSRKTGVDKC